MRSYSDMGEATTGGYPTRSTRGGILWDLSELWYSVFRSFWPRIKQGLDTQVTSHQGVCLPLGVNVQGAWHSEQRILGSPGELTYMGQECWHVFEGIG
jgi:hypothetical protein